VEGYECPQNGNYLQPLLSQEERGAMGPVGSGALLPEGDYITTNTVTRNPKSKLPPPPEEKPRGGAEGKGNW
jgi:hypothetical protein